MDQSTIKKLAARIAAALEGGDQTLTELPRLTGLDAKECERAVNYLKSQRRLENHEGLLHLRPAESESSEVPTEAAPESPGESPAATTQEIVPIAFDYAALDADTASFARLHAQMIKGLYRSTVRNVKDIGTALLAVKEKLDHGQFGKWIEGEFAWGERTAQNYMNVAERFKNENIADLNLPMTALYLLAAPSTPDRVREEITEHAESGEPVKVAEVKEAIIAARPAEFTTRTSLDADQVYQALLALPGKTASFKDLQTKTRLDETRLVKALNLISDGKKVVKSYEAGGGRYSIPIEQVIASMQTPAAATVEEPPADPAPTETSSVTDELRAHFDHDQITLRGRSDEGAWHRAIEVARKLVAAGFWDGQAPIEFDAYELHDKLFGVDRVEPADLNYVGVDVYFPRENQLTGQARVESVKRALNTSIHDLQNHILCGSFSRDELQILIDTETARPNPRTSLIKWMRSRLGDMNHRPGLVVLPERQRDMLLAIYTDQPVVKNAATRIALINRELLANGDRDNWWGDIQMTATGRQVAEALLADHVADVRAQFDSAEVTSDPIPADEPSAPVGDRAGLPMPLDAAKGLIVDALRKSQIALYPGQLMNNAGFRPEHQVMFKEALEQLIASGALAEVHEKHGSRRYHFPEMLTKLNAPEPAEDEPEASKAPRPVSPMLGVFEQDLRDLQLSMKAVMRQRFDWSTVPAERRDDLNALARETSRVAGALCQWFLALGDEIKSSNRKRPPKSN